MRQKCTEENLQARAVFFTSLMTQFVNGGNVVRRFIEMQN